MVTEQKSTSEESKTEHVDMQSEQTTSNFAAILSRLKYIERWALMRSSRQENLSEHSLEVAMIAHLLCTLANVRHGRSLDASRAALLGMYHDAAEIITGDLPTPVKYYGSEIHDAYKDVEAAAEQRLLHTLPQDLQEIYAHVLHPIMSQDEDEIYIRRLVKAADKLSALIKCLEEESTGNHEFVTAKASTQKSLEAMAQELPEVADFMQEFLPAYGKTLDELLGR